MNKIVGMLLVIFCFPLVAQADLTNISQIKKAESRHARMAFFRLRPKQKKVMFDASGPGKITHLWLTIGYGRKEGSLVDPKEAGYTDFRDFIIRMYWDNEDEPSVEVPLSELFGCGFGIREKHYSIVNAVDGRGGFTTYWPMPFKKAARIEIYNDTDVCFPIYWNIDWEKDPEISENTGYFHSYYRTDTVDIFNEYLMLEAEGQGHFTGMVYSVIPSTDKLWWGEGDEMFYIDGDPDPSVRGTGTEDYFNQSWGIKPVTRLYTGCFKSEEGTAMYRFHINDPIHFKESLKLTFQTLYGSFGSLRPSSKLASTVFWYQTEPHKPWKSELPNSKQIDDTFENVNADKCESIDISSIANMGLIDEEAKDQKGGWIDNGKYYDLRNMPTGTQTLAGVPFEIKNECVALYSPDRPYFPKETESLTINSRAKEIYFLVGTAWGQNFNDEPAGSVEIEYENGSKEEKAFRMGKELTDWLKGAPYPDMIGKPAWQGRNLNGNRCTIYAVKWENPNPNEKIKQMKFDCSDGRPVLGVFAITLSE